MTSRIDTITFTTLTANGLPGAPMSAYLGPLNGLAQLSSNGTVFGGGAITWEITLDGGATWVPLSGVSQAAAGSVAVQVASQGIRPRMTGGTTPSVVCQLGIADFGG